MTVLASPSISIVIRPTTSWPPPYSARPLFNAAERPGFELLQSLLVDRDQQRIQQT
jgi:hypothetical protein